MVELHFRPLIAYRCFALVMILTLTWLILILWQQGDIRNFVIISLFFLIGIKYFQGVLVTKVDITNTEISLSRTIGKIIINIKDISNLAIRYVDSSKMDEFPESYKYLEIFTTSGEHYIYPISSGRASHLRESDIEVITGLECKKLPKLKPRITNRYLTFNLWV